VIVVDDASTDDSARVAGARPGVRVLPARGAGPAAARNTGLRAARGEWVQFLDTDDRLVPGKIGRQVAAAAPHSSVVLSDVRAIFDSLGPRSERETFRRHRDRRDWLTALHYQNVIAVHAPIARRQLLLDISGFPEGLRVGERIAFVEDWLLWARAARAGAVFQFVPGTGCFYHHHESGATAYPLRHALSEALALRLLRADAEGRPITPWTAFALALGFDRVARVLHEAGSEDAARAIEDALAALPREAPVEPDTERDDHMRGLPPGLFCAEAAAYWAERRCAAASERWREASRLAGTPFDALACDLLTIRVLCAQRILARNGTGVALHPSASVESAGRALRLASRLSRWGILTGKAVGRYWRRPFRGAADVATRLKRAKTSS
jgi:hypothetical protein